MCRLSPFFLGFLVFLFSCSPPKSSFSPSRDISSVPEWFKEAIWYQIFVERFRNGDPSNDSKLSDLVYAYPDSLPQNWKITPWSWDWYKPDPYFKHLDKSQDHFGSKAQIRRYGGDLQGVMTQLDYLSGESMPSISIP